MTKNEYLKFLETLRDGGVISNIVIDAIKYHIWVHNGDVDWNGDAIIDHIQSYTGDVDWEEVEKSLEAYTYGWLIHTQDLMEFYSKNYKEVDGIVSQDDAFKSIWEVMHTSNASSVIDAINAACYRAYDIVLSDIVKKLKAL